MISNIKKIALAILICSLSFALLAACQLSLRADDTKVYSADLQDIINSDPIEIDGSSFPITPVEELHLTGKSPIKNGPQIGDPLADYRLKVDGLVETPLAIAYKDVLKYPTVTQLVLLICPGFFADNAEWTGVPVMTLLNEAGIKPEATGVTIYGIDGYFTSLSLDIMRRDGVFLAHTVNGLVLPYEHGYPLRLVVKGNYGRDWVKWVDRIEVT
jgi:sulfane dehydrogenase subunit SoxC